MPTLIPMANFPTTLIHALAAAIFFARLADILTTYLATPKLKLEVNPVVRRLKWPFELASLGLCLTPFLSIEAAIMILVVSLLVAAGNSSRLWLIRALGEDQYHRLLVESAGRSQPRKALIMNLIPGSITLSLGILLLIFYPNPQEEFGFYFALSIVLYAGLQLTLYPLGFLRLRRLARATTPSTKQIFKYN